jgi:hypothetical protein
MSAPIKGITPTKITYNVFFSTLKSFLRMMWGITNHKKIAYTSVPNRDVKISFVGIIPFKNSKGDISQILIITQNLNC